MKSRTAPPENSREFFGDYAKRLSQVLARADWSGVAALADEVMTVWRSGRQVFLCGNGGSAGNAMHIANDLFYGVAKRTGGGIRASALSANPSILTCLANDLGYDKIFDEQLAVHGRPGDLLIVLSGSGNSRNILNVLESARSMGIRTFAILGFSGGEALKLADRAMHFPIDDMQIAEDLQLIVGHMLMQWLYDRGPVSTETASP